MGRRPARLGRLPRGRGFRRVPRLSGGSVGRFVVGRVARPKQTGVCSLGSGPRQRSAQHSSGRLSPLASVARAIGGDVSAESATRVRSWSPCEGFLASIARTTCRRMGLLAAVKEQHERLSRLVTGRAGRPVVHSVQRTSSTGSPSISLVTQSTSVSPLTSSVWNRPSPSTTCSSPSAM
jgi:hypothetical protein